MAFSGGFLTLRLLPGRPILLALDADIVGREELSPQTPKDSSQVRSDILAQ